MPDSQGQRPLERAVYGKNIEIAELLLENGANPNQRITSGMTPGRTLLMHAVSVNNPQLVKLLIVHGADMDATFNEVRGRQAVPKLLISLIKTIKKRVRFVIC